MAGLAAASALSWAVLLVLLGAGLAAPAAAQEIPTSVAPGQIEERFDVRPRAREEVAPEIERPEIPGPPVPVEEAPFVLTAVVVEGNTVYDEAAFVPLYEDLLAREVRISDIRAVARKITDLYQRDG